MTLKPGVSLANIQPQAAVAMAIADGVYRDHGLEAVVTAGRDGKHMVGSLHYLGLAFDLRLPSRCEAVQGRPAPTAFDRALDEAVTRDLRERLTAEYDVLLETHHANRMNWHIHVEYDPK